MSSKNIIERVNAIIKQKKSSDPIGYQRVENQGPKALCLYLTADLRKAGIDPNMVPWNSVIGYSFLPGGKQTEEAILKISTVLDEVVYAPYFQSTSTSFETSILSMLSDKSKFQALDSRLRFVKVCSAGAGLLCAGAFLGALAGQKLAGVCIYGLMAIDLLRVSYNCYINNYVCLIMSKLGGNFSRASGTLFQWMTTVAGLSSTKDPFAIIQNEISWDVLGMNTITKSLYNKIVELTSESKKNN